MKITILTKGLLGDLHLPSIGGSASFTSSSAEASTSSRHTFSLHFSFNPFLHFLTTKATFCLINDLSGRFFTTEETGESATLLRSMSNKFPKKQHRSFLQKEARTHQDNVFFSFFIANGVWMKYKHRPTTTTTLGLISVMTIKGCVFRFNQITTRWTWSTLSVKTKTLTKRCEKNCEV